MYQVPGMTETGALDYDGTDHHRWNSRCSRHERNGTEFWIRFYEGTMLINLDTDQSGEITLKDTDGTVLVSYTPVRDFNSVVISCEELEEGGSLYSYDRFGK